MSAVASEPEPVIRERVPVYAEHTLKRFDRKAGKVITEEVTADRLQTIADLRNKKIEETGNDSLIIVGHTKPGLSEWEQAERCPTVGYADRYEVGTHERTGKATLYARLKYKPTCEVGGKKLTAEQVIDRFPRRSAELWLDENDLDAISLLGPTTPALDLDLLRMARAADPDVAVAAPSTESPMEPQGDKCQQLAMALMQVIEQFMGGPEQNEAPPPAPGAPPAGGDTPAQYARAEQERIRMQRDQDAIRGRQSDARLAAVEAELAATKLQYQRTRREQDLIQLEAEGYDLDRAEELDRLTPLPDETYTAELGRMKKRYQRMPVGAMIRTAEPRPAGGGTIFDRPADHEQVKDLIMSGRAKSPEEARQMLKAG